MVRRTGQKWLRRAKKARVCARARGEARVPTRRGRLRK